MTYSEIPLKRFIPGTAVDELWTGSGRVMVVATFNSIPGSAYAEKHSNSKIIKQNHRFLSIYYFRYYFSSFREHYSVNNHHNQNHSVETKPKEIRVVAAKQSQCIVFEIVNFTMKNKYVVFEPMI